MCVRVIVVTLSVFLSSRISKKAYIKPRRRFKTLKFATFLNFGPVLIRVESRPCNTASYKGNAPITSCEQQPPARCSV